MAGGAGTSHGRHPVVLGSGKRLFPLDAPDKQELTLTEHRTFANGVQLQVLDAVR
jgi:hypothetical protein